MEDVVGIYAKVIISFYGFVVPSFSILITFLYKGILLSKNEHEEELKQFVKISKDSIKDEDENYKENLKDTLKVYQKNEKRIKKHINLLNPFRQILRIFSFLSIAIIFIGAYHFEKTNIFDLNNIWIKAFTLLLSISAFMYSLYALWQLFNTIIQTRIKMISDEMDEIVNPEIK